MCGKDAETNNRSGAVKGFCTVEQRGGKRQEPKEKLSLSLKLSGFVVICIAANTCQV